MESVVFTPNADRGIETLLHLFATTEPPAIKLLRFTLDEVLPFTVNDTLIVRPDVVPPLIMKLKAEK